MEKKKAGGPWEKVSDAPIQGETATVPNLDEGEEYEYRVAAVTDAGVGDYSNATPPVRAEKKKSWHKLFCDRFIFLIAYHTIARKHMPLCLFRKIYKANDIAFEAIAADLTLLSFYIHFKCVFS